MWEDTDVRLLITTYADNKHLFGGKATKKDVFEKIAEQFTKAPGRLVTGEHCLRKWRKITSKQKEIEDHNNKSRNDKKTWKFYEELSECLAKDATINPVRTVESSIHVQSAENQSSTSSCSATGSSKLSDESSSESTLDEPCNKS